MGDIWTHPQADRRAQATSIEAGEVWSVMGPPDALLTTWLQGWMSAHRADGYSARVWWASDPGPSRRTTPHSLIAQAAGRPRLARIADALGATGLADLRSRPLAELTLSGRLRAAVAAALAAEADLLVLDGVLDGLDPWHEPAVTRALAARAADGTALIIGTGRCDIAEQWDRLMVLRRGEIAYQGSAARLRDRQARVTIETDDPAGVQALLPALELTVTETGRGLEFAPGEADPAVLALMRQGWGRVRAWVVYRPSLAEVLASDGW